MQNPDINTLQTLERLYRQYQVMPETLTEEWRSFFEGMNFSEELSVQDASYSKELMRSTYRSYGHLFADVNPLFTEEKKPLFSDVKNPSEELIRFMQIYAGPIGFEYMHVDNEELKKFIQSKIEPELKIEFSENEKKEIFEKLVRAELFETFLHRKFVGQTRFSLQGAETFLPMVAMLLERGAKEYSLEECIIGIAHRGRVNLLANVLQKSISMIFHEFHAEYEPHTLEGSSDVIYHKGYSADYETSSGKKVHIHMTPNPSHLESIDPVILGQVKAKQILKQDDTQQKVLPLIVHGDASIAGQGVVYESLGLMKVDGYSVGGALHIIINNQIGFTTLPEEGRSQRYASDIAKAFGSPVFHVNVEDPESAIFACLLALEIRQKFQIDVFIDLLCYRKYGHNEGDDPSFTQPKIYDLIKDKESPREIYGKRPGGLYEKYKGYEELFKKELEEHFSKMDTFHKKELQAEELFGSAWKEYIIDEKIDDERVDTKVSPEVLREIIHKTSSYPEGFTPHPKLIKWMEERKSKVEDLQEKRIDWALAEHLAFGSILIQGVPIRLSGEDVCRGTFNQRHAAFIDQKTEEKYIPLAHLKEGQGLFTIYNSILSEMGVVAFEYGYSLSSPQTLVIWEAQYGDFVNGAQVIIDQYIASGEMKWSRRSALTMMLPHGSEGKGPEHTSARIERFLQLAGEENIQVIYPSTPAQLFHVLRKQALRKLKKPLILFTPKSLLRSPLLVSSVEELVNGEFQRVIADLNMKAKKVLLCSGKIYYDLVIARDEQKKDIAIVRIEELYPFPKKILQDLLISYTNAKEFFWVQEEPKNMGAWSYLYPYFEEITEKKVRYIGRDAKASTAEGSHELFKKSQQQIVLKAMEEI